MPKIEQYTIDTLPVFCYTPGMITTDWGSKVLAILKLKQRDIAWLAREVCMQRSLLSRLIHGDPHRHLSPKCRMGIAKVLEVPEELIWGNSK